LNAKRFCLFVHIPSSPVAEDLLAAIFVLADIFGNYSGLLT
jgi:hypothetical protein